MIHAVFNPASARPKAARKPAPPAPLQHDDVEIHPRGISIRRSLTQQQHRIRARLMGIYPSPTQTEKVSTDRSTCEVQCTQRTFASLPCRPSAAIANDRACDDASTRAERCVLDERRRDCRSIEVGGGRSYKRLSHGRKRPAYFTSLMPGSGQNKNYDWFVCDVARR